VVAGGPATGCRALDIRVSRGLDIRVLPDRGFDVGAAWFRGVPIAWVSAVGETAPLPQPRGVDWNDAFGGGLIATCGLRNVGAPSEGHGQHGTFSHLRAQDVSVERGDDEVIARARIVDASAIGHRLEVEREIRTRAGSGHVTLSDVTTNLGPDPEPAPLLYHVNVGPPLWDAGARLEIDSKEVVPRDDDARAALATWDEAPALEPGAPERVFEHVGATRAAVVNEGIRLEVTSDLPRLWQWTHPGYGVLGIEPANCSVLGRAHDRAEGRLPVLEPGEERRTSVTVVVEEL
jgi:Domain of unknown function (DUF4432)